MVTKIGMVKAPVLRYTLFVQALGSSLNRAAIEYEKLNQLFVDKLLEFLEIFM